VNRHGDAGAEAAPPDDRYLTWDAAYVLGALSDAERREYEEHLAGCGRCRSAVAELSGIPALLSTLDAGDVRALDEQPDEPPPLRPEVLASVLDRVGSRRRRYRRVTTAAVGLAAALLAAGAVIAIRPEVVGLQPNTSVQAGAPSLEMAKVSPTPINASISMSGFGWGTRIDMTCTYGDWGNRDAPPQTLAMVVIGRDGSRSEIATWLGLSGATAMPSANTPMQPEEIAAVQMISTPDGTVLLERKL
jgi:Putative zinc-finger